MLAKAPRKDKVTLAELIIIVLLIAVLMTIFLGYFFKHQDQVTRTGFNNVSQVFAARLNAMRAQWMMSGQPRFILIADEISKQEVKISINNKGWVTSQNSDSGCENIWLQIMGSSLDERESPITAIFLIVNTDGIVKQSVCQYSLSSGEYFTYNVNNGLVSAIKILL